jgi:hypothetical protein
MTELLAKLRKLNPYKIVVWNGDESRTVAVPQRRRRWPQVMEAIESGPWTRVVLQDKSGADLGYVDSGHVEEEPERSLVRSGVDPMAHAIAINELVLRAQKQTADARDKELTALLKAQGEVVGQLVSAVRSLQQVWQAQVEAAQDVAAMQTEAAMGGGGWKELLEAAPQLVPLLPHLRSMFQNGAPKVQ